MSNINAIAELDKELADFHRKAKTDFVNKLYCKLKEKQALGGQMKGLSIAEEILIFNVIHSYVSAHPVIYYLKIKSNPQRFSIDQ